jgi:SAM-dependent methyltransferase
MCAGVDSTNLKWLDVGCGRGELLEIAGANFAMASGCDPSPSMLPSNSSFRVYEQRSPVKLPFIDETWDLVTAVCVFHHVHGRNRTLLFHEIRRVLRPGGLCCIFEHNPWNPMTRSIVGKCPLDAEAALLTAGGVSHLLQLSGFEHIQKEYFLYLPERLYGKFAPIERLFSRVPLGGQYVVLAKAPLTSMNCVAGSEVEEEYATVSSLR